MDIRTATSFSDMRIARRLRHFCTALVGVSMLTAFSANAGFVSVEFASVVTVDGAVVDASGEFILDDTVPWGLGGTVDDVLVGGGFRLGDEMFDLNASSAFSFVAANGDGDTMELVGDYGPQIFFLTIDIASFFVQSDPLATLLNLTLADLLPSSQFVFFAPNSTQNFAGPITEFSVTQLPAAVSEPAILGLLGMGLVSIWATRRRRVA